LAGEAVPQFIASHGKPALLTGLLTRWSDGICPLTQGLSPGFNAFLSARLRAVAATVGVPRQTAAKCRPNISILFTTEPQKLLDAIAKKNPGALGFHYPHQTKKLAVMRRAIQAWYVTGSRGQTRDELDTSGRIAPHRLGGHLDTGGLRGLIAFVMVIADTSKLTDYAIGSVSDYITMLVLSQQASLDGCGTLPSIIDLMASACNTSNRSDAMTAGDLAYLKALYSIDMEQPIFLEQADMQNIMMREFRNRQNSKD
jgi:hypothetical protein